MKTRRKLSLLSVLAIGAALSPLGVKAEANVMPTAVDGRITLTEDVILTSDTKVIKNTGDLTIDLAGHSLKRSQYYGYLINNESKNAKLTIIDSVGTGSIVCEQENDPRATNAPSSCIRNNGTMEIDGVKIEAEENAFIVLKNEEDSTLTVKNSNIKACSTRAGGIQNWGTLTVEDSYIEGAKDPEGAAIFALSWNKDGNIYSSSATIKNSTLNAYWAVIMQHNKAAVEGETVKIAVENSNLQGMGGLARIDRVKATTSTEDLTLELKGNITASSEALGFLKEGSTLTLNATLEDEITIKEGYTLVVPAGIEVGENIKVEEGAKVINNSGKDLTITVLGTENEKFEIKNGETFNGTIPETPEDPSDVENPTDPEEKPSDVEEPKADPEEKPNTPSENPKTLDTVHLYTGFVVMGVVSLIAMLKKKIS